MWNSLPVDVKNIDSFNRFKEGLKLDRLDSPSQTIVTFQLYLWQHCWVQHAACVWSPCHDAWQHIPTCWMLLAQIWKWWDFRAAFVDVAWGASIMPKIPEISVGIQMESFVSVSSDRNIRDHLWRCSTYFGRNIPTEIRRSIYDKPVLCSNLGIR